MTETSIPTFKLNDGQNIPSFGFGTFQIPADGSTYQAVKTALADGYRHDPDAPGVEEMLLGAFDVHAND